MAIRSEVTVLRIPIHPGDILNEESKERKIKQKDFAKQIGMQPSHLNELLHGKRDMTKEIALKIEEALEIDADFWMRCAISYERDLKAKHDRERQSSFNNEMSRIGNIIDLSALFNRLGIAAGSLAERFKAFKEMFPPVSNVR